ncbi:MAG: hypothetical protein WBA24_18320 [Geitlerinemataceae cyanobacterium]
MAFLRQIVAPFFILLIFLVALAATSARIILPDDLSSPAPVEEIAPSQNSAELSVPPTEPELSSSLSLEGNSTSDERAL